MLRSAFKFGAFCNLGTTGHVIWLRHT